MLVYILRSHEIYLLDEECFVRRALLTDHCPVEPRCEAKENLEGYKLQSVPSVPCSIALSCLLYGLFLLNCTYSCCLWQYSGAEFRNERRDNIDRQLPGTSWPFSGPLNDNAHLFVFRSRIPCVISNILCSHCGPTSRRLKLSR